MRRRQMSNYVEGEEMKNQPMSSVKNYMSSLDQVINSEDVNKNSIESRILEVRRGRYTALKSSHRNGCSRCGDAMGTDNDICATECQTETQR